LKRSSGEGSAQYNWFGREGVQARDYGFGTANLFAFIGTVVHDIGCAESKAV
jgi:hypothetical protein